MLVFMHGQTAMHTHKVVLLKSIQQKAPLKTDTEPLS